MSKKFLNKVTAERTVLSAINNHYVDYEALQGLTKISIKSWIQNNKIEPHDARINLLFRISDLCQTMSDRSQESFESIDSKVMDKVNKNIPKLLI